MVKDHSDSERGNPLPHMGYSFRLTARVLLYAPSHKQDNTYHSQSWSTGWNEKATFEVLLADSVIFSGNF